MPSEQASETDAELGRRTVRGAAWTYGAMAIGLLVQVAYTSIMSRLLSPRDFGIIAAAIVGTQLVSLLGRMGIAAAVTQKSSLTDFDLQVAHGLSIAVGVGAFIVTTVLSGPLSYLVRSPQSAPVMIAIGAGFLIASLGAVPEACMRRAFRFKELAIWQVSSSLVSSVAAGIVPALLGAGYWSIVASNLAQLTLYSAAMVGATRIVRPRFESAAARGFLSFGGKVTLISLLEYGSKTADNLSVSRWLGQTQLGYYSRGQVLVGLVSENAFTSANRVLQPALSRVKDDRQRFGTAYTRAAGLLSLTIFAPVTVITVCAPVLVRIVLGNGWDETTRVLPVLAIGYSIGAWCNFHGVATEAAGQLSRKLVLQIANLVVAVIAMATVVYRGPTLIGFAVAWAFSESLRAFMYIVFILPKVGVPILRLLSRTATVIGLSAAIASPAFVVVRVAGSRSLPLTIAAGLLGLALGASVVLCLPNSWLASELRRLRSALTGH